MKSLHVLSILSFFCFSLIYASEKPIAEIVEGASNPHLQYSIALPSETLVKPSETFVLTVSILESAIYKLGEANEDFTWFYIETSDGKTHPALELIKVDGMSSKGVLELYDIKYLMGDVKYSLTIKVKSAVQPGLLKFRVVPLLMACEKKEMGQCYQFSNKAHASMSKFIPPIYEITLNVLRPSLAVVGSQTPDCQILLDDGSNKLLSAVRGNQSLMIIFASPLSPAFESMGKTIERQQTAWKKTGLSTLVIFTGVSAQEIKSIKTDKGWTFPVALDASSETAKLFGVTEMPYVFVIRADGIIEESKTTIPEQE